MQKKYACVRYLHTRVTVYHPCKIDLRYSRALHSCLTCKFLRVGLPCSAIHYGVCGAAPLPVPARPSPSSSSPSPTSSSSSPASPAQPPLSPGHAPAPPSALPASKPSAGHVPIPVVALVKRPSSSPAAAAVVNDHAGPERSAGPAPPHDAGPPPSTSLAGPVRVVGQSPLHKLGPAPPHDAGPPPSSLGRPVHVVGQSPAHQLGAAAGSPVQQESVGSVAVQRVGATTQVVVRTGPEGGLGFARGGVVVAHRPVGARTPVRVVVSKPAPGAPSPGISFSFSAAEDEVYPAFPVSPEDKMQVHV